MSHSFSFFFSLSYELCYGFRKLGRIFYCFPILISYEQDETGCLHTAQDCEMCRQDGHYCSLHSHFFICSLRVVRTDVRGMRRWWAIPRLASHFLKLCYIYIYIYIYAFSRRFYPKRLTLHSSYSFYIFISSCFPWELNP